MKDTLVPGNPQKRVTVGHQDPSFVVGGLTLLNFSFVRFDSPG